MVPFNSENYINAVFTNDKEDTIQVYYTYEDELHEYFIANFEDNPILDELLKIVSIEKIDENTTEYVKEQRAEFKKLVKTIAEEDGLIIKDSDKSEISHLITRAITQKEEDIDKEELFAFKLAIFEIEEIRDSENSELKTYIRKAKNYRDILRAYLQIVE